MKRILLLQLCALLLILFTAASSGRHVDDKGAVRQLMEQRIGILSYYYGGKMSFHDARNNIAKITAEELFHEDVAHMEGFSDTEVDQITDYSLKVISCHRSNFGIVKGEVQVYWVLYGQEGFWKTEEKYYYTAEIDEKNMKLTQLKKL